MKKPLLKPLVLATSTLVWCALNLHAQIAPTITTQPASQTNAVGSNVVFNVTVNGTGPFTYQWQFNGTNLPNNIITTVAGNGSTNYAGDGGAATNASLNFPSSIALDFSGNLYIADYANHRIRKVDLNGIITTVAGNGTASFAGDGSAATNASLYNPQSVASDISGNLYIADLNNNRIRKVDTNGTITTVAGNGIATYAGDGGAATNASLNYPTGVACDTFGNLYVSDDINLRIRKVDTNGIITTVAGNGNLGYFGEGGAATNARLASPLRVACDVSGNVYIADLVGIRKVDTNGIITTVAGSGSFGYSGDGGAATNASLYEPIGMAFDAAGNFYIADDRNNRVRKVDTNGIITTAVGNGIGTYAGDGGAATNASLYSPTGLAFDASGNLYISDYRDNHIRKVLLYAEYPTLKLNNIGAVNAGNYTVVISSSYGSVTSAVATLTVTAPPAITGQPASQTVAVGSSPSFSVVVLGSGPFGYSLYFGGTNLIQTGTNNTFTLVGVSTNNTGNYTVVITNSYGSVTSQVATLTVALPPIITTQPASQTNLAGTIMTFNVTAGGIGPFNYQWQFNGTNLPNEIMTVAGNGSTTYAGDGSAATSASLYVPSGVALDASGTLYIADYGNNRVRKVDTNGIITTMAGNGIGTYAGDGGAATNAAIYYPEDLTADAFGNLYIVDEGNSRIRKISANGIITTVAGNGSSSYSGDGGPATNGSLYPEGVTLDHFGNLYIADTYNNRIRKVDTNGIITTVAGNGPNYPAGGSYAGDGGAATNARLYWPPGVAFDPSGNLLIADDENNRVRKVDTNGIITTVAGNGNGAYAGDGAAATSASLYLPHRVVFDTFGNLYIADNLNSRIRKVTSNGVITTVAGNGTFGYSGDGGVATNASLYKPSGLALDLSGNLYIADVFNNRIREVHFAINPIFALTRVSVTNAGNYSVVITSPYGSVTSSVAVLNVPATIITQQPTNQVVTNGGTAVFSVSASGPGPFTYQWLFNGNNVGPLITSIAGGGASYPGDGGFATNAFLYVPQGVALDAQGDLYIAAFGDNRINKVDTNGIITTVAGNGSAGHSGDGGSATNASLFNPSSIALDTFGNLYIAEWGSNYIRKVDIYGVITTVAGNGTIAFSGDGGAATNASLNRPSGVVLDALGNLYIADYYNNRIRKMDTNGIITTMVGNGSTTYAGDGGAATNAGLAYPSGVVFDISGNMYIANYGNNRIRKVDTNGIITTVAGNGNQAFSGDGSAATNASLNWPTGVSLDAAGNLYIADDFNNRIRKVDTNGIITTVAGDGPSYPATGSYSGDDGVATNASLSNPSSVVVDANNNLYIADSGNGRIRKLLFSPANLSSFTITSINTNNIGSYSVIVSNSYGSITSAVAALFMPAFITVQPTSRVALAGSNASFVVTAGGPGPFAFAWYFGGTNLIQSGTNGTLALLGVTPTNAGNYIVVVTNDYGSVTSSVAVLTVVPAIITAQPINQTAVIGSSPSFSVAVAGSGPFVYEWFFAGTNLVQSGTNSTLMLAGVSTNNSGNYAVVITNAYGSVTSMVASLVVGLPPSVIAQPLTQTNAYGTAVSFNVTVGGTGPFTYQWQFNGTNLPNNIITTVAGKSTSGYSGDGGSATNASLSSPYSVTLDTMGNLYIADYANNCIREVATNGIINTVVGKSSPGYSGDGGAATNASLRSPAGVALDASGNLFIADGGNNRIRKIDINGIITTVAGNGTSGYSGDGGAATNANISSPEGVGLDFFGNLYIADRNTYRIRKVDLNGIITTVAGKSSDGYSGDGGAATNASLYNPTGVALNYAGNLYIADWSNNRIRKVDTNGIITTVAGNGNQGFSGDGGAASNASLNGAIGVVLDGFGNIYIADQQNNRVRKVSTNGIITTVAGKSASGYAGDGGAATNASLYQPFGVALDTSGNLYIADRVNNRVREVHFAGYPTFALTNASVTNAGNYSVVITSSYGSVTSQVATLTIAPSIITLQPASQIVGVGSSPSFSVAVTGSGIFGYNWYFGGTNLVQSGTNNTLKLHGVSTNSAGNYSVVVTNAYGSVTSQVAVLTVVLPPTITSQPVSQTNLSGSIGTFNITVVGIGPFTYQWQFNGTNLPNNIITTMAGNGSYSYSGDGSAATNTSLGSPTSIAFDATGNLYIADYGNSRIRKMDTNGVISTLAGNGNRAFSGDGGAATNASLYYPIGVACDSFGNLYIADYDNNRIRKVDTNGIITTMAGNGFSAPINIDGVAATNAYLNMPCGVALNAAGNLYIADFGNDRIRKVDTNGIITTVAGEFNAWGYSGDGGAATNARLYAPTSIAFDATGNLLIADSNNNRVRKVNTNGVITTVAGNATRGYAGDGGLATNASLYLPKGVAIDAFGNLFIADFENNRIRSVDTNGLINAAAGNGPSLNGSYSGDGGAATNASLYFPFGEAFDAAGNLYIADSYNNRIREVHFAGYPTFTLTNVSITNAGNYTVVITSPYGSVTSVVATLTVIVPPQIIVGGINFGFTTNGSVFGFNLSGMVGQTIVVDGSTNLMDWTPLFTNTVGTNSVYFFDPTSTNFPGRFYRARLP